MSLQFVPANDWSTSRYPMNLTTACRWKYCSHSDAFKSFSVSLLILTYWWQNVSSLTVCTQLAGVLFAFTNISAISVSFSNQRLQAFYVYLNFVTAVDSVRLRLSCVWDWLCLGLVESLKIWLNAIAAGARAAISLVCWFCGP